MQRESQLEISVQSLCLEMNPEGDGEEGLQGSGGLTMTEVASTVPARVFTRSSVYVTTVSLLFL